MTIGIQSLVNCVNTAISVVCDPLPILQLSSVAQDFEQGFVKSVTNCAALPDAALNRGRWIYLEDTCGYRYSDGVGWTNDFLSEPGDLQAWAWGFNTNGQLGDQTATDRSSPVIISGGFADWCEINAGNSHSLAVRTDGTAWAWGSNGQGRLGDGSVTNQSSPVSVVGGFGDWCQISAGGNHSLAVRTDGTAWAWGFNGNGRLGDGSVTNRNSPVSVVGGFGDWCQISAGRFHSLAVRTDGSAWAWGYNGQGRLGDGSVTNQSSPVSVVGGFSDWCEISAGLAHSLAVRTDGTAWAWGCNTNGQLGDSTITDRSSPVSVIGGFGDWCEISAGDSHSLAVRTDGTAWAWGFNGNGRLGDLTVTARSSPVSVVGGFGDWCEISAGGAHSLAVKTDGTAWAWGLNSNGRLGDLTVTSRTSPVSVVGGFGDWCQISAGLGHSLAIRVGKGF
jgi:alpha-tubulin suppressor-like RCC1 family protein